MTRRKDILFLLAILCAVGFASTSWLWDHYLNLFVSIPFGVVSFTAWNHGRKNDDRPFRYGLLPLIWLLGIFAACWPI